MLSTTGVVLFALTQAFSTPSAIDVGEKVQSIELVSSEKPDVLPCNVVRNLAVLDEMVRFYQQLNPDAVLELNGNRQHFVSNSSELITLLRITASGEGK